MGIEGVSLGGATKEGRVKGFVSLNVETEDDFMNGLLADRFGVVVAEEMVREALW